MPAVRGCIAWLLLASAVGACSLSNREGPEVTCAELECGRVNACQDGIIAQCVDGETVRYHVCFEGGDDICDASWQIEGEYRCLEFATDCEGCRPERVEGCGFFDNRGAGGN